MLYKPGTGSFFIPTSTMPFHFSVFYLFTWSLRKLTNIFLIIFLSSADKGKKDALIGWEMELARRFEIDQKGFCLYHMQDFKRLSETNKQKLYQHHTRTLHLLPCPIGS
jgi:hypothetical protein